MAAFIFLCDLSTEQECLDRKLFGTNPGERHELHYRKVAVGDSLFLYNFETGTLRGTFTATTACQMNIEPKAWKRTRRSFPWQVRVSDVGLLEIPLRADSVSKIIPLSRTPIGLLPAVEPNDAQLESLVMALIEANSSLTSTTGG